MSEVYLVEVRKTGESQSGETTFYRLDKDKEYVFRYDPKLQRFIVTVNVK